MKNEKVFIKERLKEFLSRLVFLEKQKLEDKSLIFIDGYFDSMGFMRILTYIEKEYGIKISDSEMVEKNFESINAITDFIFTKINH